MQIKKILLLGYLCIHFFSTYSQQTALISISGTIRDIAGNGVEGATIYISNGNGAYTDKEGVYKLTQVKPGEQQITVSALGYDRQVKSIVVEPNREAVLNFVLKTSIKEMEEVSVIGRTESQEVNRQAYNVTAIDARSLHNSTLDVAHALDRVSGVRVRESGGVGSDFSFSLNGFSGNRVKFFVDGVPMDNFGSSFQINNIPINFAERIEVYKGVVPVWLGSDALAGAVNIITGSNRRNFLDVAYSYGSFNTHRSSVNVGYTSKSGFAFRLNAYQNYSDNNYWQYVTAGNIVTGQYYDRKRIKRFHDKYHNEMVVAEVGVVDKQYADRLFFGVSLGKNYKEVQNGVRLNEQVYGAWHRRGNIVMPTLKYQKKDLLVKGLDLTVNGNFNLGEEQNIDTVNGRFGWFGEFKPRVGSTYGGEQNWGLYRYKNNNGSATATATYHINGGHALTLNNVFTTFNRKGYNELDESSILYKSPQRTQKNITGLGYKFDYNDRWSTSIFGKYYHQSIFYRRSYNPSGNWGDVAYEDQSGSTSRFGYGLATSYFIKTNFQLKASYEKSVRLPENEELFGDLVTKASNFNLKPESSHNVNLGVHYSFNVQDNHHFVTALNGIYRYATDYIYEYFNLNQVMSIADNRDGVSNIGGDVELRYSYRNFFTIGTNVTYQNLRNKQKREPNYEGISPLYNDRMPNAPFLFGNADASVFFRDVAGKGNDLTFGYNLLYVHAFYLYWPSRGSEKLDIPKQFSHDVNVVYSLKNGKYNVALECKNLTDSELFDNFSLPKPSRSFNVKLRYFINR